MKSKLSLQDYEIIYQHLCNSFSQMYKETSPWYIGNTILDIYKKKKIKRNSSCFYYLDIWYKNNPNIKL